MDRIELSTPDLTEENIQKLGELFPQVLTEVQDEAGEVRQAVDFDALRDLLGDVAEGQRERYQFTWPGKREAKAEARRPIDKTLRPCPEESVDWDITENLYIEGDNLDALKILKETYAGKVKMIYIDPPYNTGHDFIYRDRFARTHGEYDGETADYNDKGERLVENLESNGRFHSDWCSMMYPRLLLARDLLTDDGVIFISIDDHEQENVKKVCNEVFGESNFLAQVIWERAYSPVNLRKHFSESHDYIICYARNMKLCVCNGLPRSAEANSRYSNPDNDPRGVWKSSDLSVGPRIESRVYEIATPSGRKVLPPSGYCWRLDKKTFEEYVKDNRIWFGSDGNNVPSIKRFISEVKQGMTPMTVWKYAEVGHSQDAAQKLKKLFDDNAFFDYPKPVGLIGRCLQLYASQDCYTLDFFSGSATTAHAVMQLNAEDGGSRKCILIQWPEETDEKSEAAKAGYKNICEIGKERIRRAGAKIKADVEDANKNLKLGETPKKIPDIGFRVLKIESSSFKDTLATPDEINQQMLFDLQDNVKGDRSDMDLLFEVLPKFRIPYSAKIEELSLCGKRCFNVEDGQLIACFDANVGVDTIEAMAKMRPVYAVMRDASMVDDATHANFEELFKTYSPETVRRVI